MKLYAAIYNDSDEYTYFSKIWLGVFDDRSKADQCILEEVESGEYNWRKLEDYQVDEIELNKKLE